METNERHSFNRLDTIPGASDKNHLVHLREVIIRGDEDAILRTVEEIRLRLDEVVESLTSIKSLFLGALSPEDQKRIQDRVISMGESVLNLSSSRISLAMAVEDLEIQTGIVREFHSWLTCYPRTPAKAAP